MRLIDADRLLKVLSKYEDDLGNFKSEYEYGLMQMLETIGYEVEDAPTIEAVPVVHGHWIKKRYWSEGVGMGESYGYWYACSECNHEVRSGYGSCDDRFCSNCGADMKEDDEHGKIN